MDPLEAQNATKKHNSRPGLIGEVFHQCKVNSQMLGRGKLRGSQIDASDALHDFSCIPCSDDGKNTEALFQCTDCQVYYCQRCVAGHNKFTKNHNVVDKSSKLFGRGQRQPRPSSSSELPTDLCEEHQGEVIKMYCGKHDLVCCTVCIAVKHRSCHGVEYIPNVTKQLLKKQDKGKTRTSLEKVKDDLQNLKRKMQNELKELGKQRDGILDDIQKFTKRLIARVEELGKKSIKEVQEKHRKIADDLNASGKNIDDMMKEVEMRLSRLNDYRTTNNESQTFVDIKYGVKQVSDGNNCVKQYAARKAEILEFEGDRSIENSLHEVQCLGKLIVWSTDEGSGDVSYDPYYFGNQKQQGYGAKKGQRKGIQRQHTDSKQQGYGYAPAGGGRGQMTATVKPPPMSIIKPVLSAARHEIRKRSRSCETL